MLPQACKTPDQLDLKAAYVDSYLSPHSSEECPHGLPWGSCGWESTCQLRGHGLHPWPWKIPHATECRSPYSATTEPMYLGPVPCNGKGSCNGKTALYNWMVVPAHRNQRRRSTVRYQYSNKCHEQSHPLDGSPCSPQPEKAHRRQWRRSTAR